MSKIDKLLEEIEEARPTNLMGLASSIAKNTPEVVNLVELVYQSDGIAALMRTRDGNAYEVMIRPAEYSKHPSIRNKT